MSGEADVLVLGQAVEAPDGFTLDRLVAATYSLDLAVALGIPLGAIRDGAFAGAEASDGSRWAILEAIRTLGARYRVFCDAGGIGVPSARLQRITQLLGEIVVPVAVPKQEPGRGSRPSFHPKFLVARFVRKGERPRLRLVCMSRNLTSDPSLDVSILLEGVDTGRVRRSQGSHRFAAALQQLPQWAAPARRTPATLDLTRQLARSVARTEWEPPAGFSDVSLWPLGFGDDEDPMRPEDGENDYLVMSPFLRASRLRELRAKRGRAVLISSAHELQAVGVETAERFEAHAFGGFDPDLTSVEPEDSVERGRETRPAALSSGLHAKLYVAEGRDDVRVIAGSANATGASVQGNAEMMVECVGTKRRGGPFTIASLLDPEGDLAPFLVPWEPDPDEDAAAREGPSPAETLMREIIACGASGDVLERSPDEFDVRIEVDGGDRIEVPAGTRISARMGNSRSEAFDLGASPAVLLRGLMRRQVGPYLTVVVELEGEKLERLLPLELSGLDLRDLQTELIKGGGGDESVLAYIAFVLDGAEGGAEVTIEFGNEAEPPPELTNSTGEAAGPAFDAAQPTLEKLVKLAHEARTSADARQRMDDVADAVEAYRHELPDDFLEAWEAVRIGARDA